MNAPSPPVPLGDATAWQRLLALYPVLAELPADMREAVLGAHLRRLEVGAGTLLFAEGAPCQGFPMVLAGSIRVARGSPGGRVIELYRVGPGEMCVVSTSCLFGHVAMAAHGVATEPSTLMVLDPAGFERWCENASFRRHVFGVFADRLVELMALAEAVAFQRLDQRLAHALLGHGSTVHVTHQALADELGTVREIVTRLLKRFERAGWVRVGRERIELLDAPALRRMAAGSAAATPGAPA